ncbi:MAG: 4-hydroxythreonine-4-phosphate dehydrogenase PdxA [Burkholderiaceae bacterium]|nr:4-hydroxythreonine-4-phosphate dehydrogenase PdxA [Burkholderiaceae bacterium]
MTSTGKTLLITMGDACGIGPEIAVAAWAAERRPPQPLCLVGDVAVYRRALRCLGLQMPVAQLSDLGELDEVPPDCLPVWVPAGLPPDLLQCPVGQVDARAGRAAAVCIEAAVAAVQRGQAQGLVTAPLHKEALALAGVQHPGHTEMLQALASADGPWLPVRMMLANEELRTVLVTIHVSVREALDLINEERVFETLRITDAALRRMGLAQPRIAVAGLNPHAGEGGLFGDEEALHIAPAIRRARAAGMQVSGPFAPDTVFMRARDAAGHPGEFDVVVAMLHDHGLIPVKYLGVEQGVNVTLGLPFVRTSPDHGTAFDLAGKGLADPSSMTAAIRMARKLAG